MAAPGSRCPHCNAPLTLVDGKAPVECPYCHTLLAAPQRTPMGAPAGKPNLAPVMIVAGLLVMMGMGMASYLFTAPVPQSSPAPAAAVPPEELPPARPPPPPKVEAPPSPVKKLRSFGERGTNPGQLQAPTNLAVASDGSVFVAETGTGRVQRFDTEGVFQGVLEIAPDKLTKQLGVFGLASDATGHVYVNRVGDVLVYDAKSLALVRTIAGDYPDRYYHGGIAIDGTGTVYAVTDRMGDGAIVKTNGTGKLAGTVKADAKDLAVDGTGQLFLVSNSGFEVRSPKGEIASKVAGLGGRSLAFDGKGHVFIARGSSVEVVSPGGDQRVTLPVATDEVALDAQGRLYAIESGVVSVYEVTIP